MEVNKFIDFFEKVCVEDLSVFVVHECEVCIDVFSPKVDYSIKLLLDSGFYLGALDELDNIFLVFVEFKVEEVTKAELGVHSIESRA